MEPQSHKFPVPSGVGYQCKKEIQKTEQHLSKNLESSDLVVSTLLFRSQILGCHNSCNFQEQITWKFRSSFDVFFLTQKPEILLKTQQNHQHVR